jgi:type II secretory pathway pseudopilin PulG
MTRRRSAEAGDTLVEVAIAVVIFLITALGVLPVLGAARATGQLGTAQLQALGLVEGRVNAILGDLSLGETQSPLFLAMPLDFATRYVTASGNSAAPWNLSTAVAYDSISGAGLSGYQMQTTLQYFDDPADGTGAADVDGDPHDALLISVQIVPTQSGVTNVYSTTWLQTYWYRNP